MDLDEIATDPQRVEPWRVDDESLITLLSELSARMRQLDALRVHLAHEAHERCLNQKVGASSTAAWTHQHPRRTHPRRPHHPPHPRAPTPRPRRPRLRLHLPRLWPTRRLDRRPPHNPLVQRRRDETVEPRPALPLHHRLIHKGDWEIFIGDDSHPRFLPPKWIDPDRRPVPAHNRRHLQFAG